MCGVDGDGDGEDEGDECFLGGKERGEERRGKG